MKVALLITHDLSLDSRVQKFASTLVENGHEAFVVSSASNSEDTKRLFSVTNFFVKRLDEEMLEKIWSRLPNYAKRFITDQRVKIHKKRIERISSRLCEKLIDLEPDLIHANDPDTLMAAHRYYTLRNVPYIYDSHEDFNSLERPDPAWKIVMNELESLFIHDAKCVVTVSEEIAETLKLKYGLKDPPYVVLNTPKRFKIDGGLNPSDVRKDLNLNESDPLHVYIGSATPRRGLLDFIDALSKLPSHKGVLMLPNSNYANSLKKHIRKSGLQERVWVIPYVAQNRLLGYISTATSGVSPLLHFPNHEVSCFTKFYEYLNAGLPVVTSDVRTMAKTVSEEKVGFIYTAGNVDELAKTLEYVADQSRALKLFISESIGSRFLWESQESIIAEIYGS